MPAKTTPIKSTPIKSAPQHARPARRRSCPPPAQFCAGAAIAMIIAVATAALGSVADGVAPDRAALAAAPARMANGAASKPTWLAPPSLTGTGIGTVPAVAAVAAAIPTRFSSQAPADSAVISGLAGDGIPSVALNAYRVASARLAHAQPTCGLRWYLLAGIGREESDHGRANGAALRADGLSTPPVIGPALDGTRGDRIPAPRNGRALDGDAVYAHALGPMQFIPSTWAAYGADGDHDGTADVFDINDAALGAARYMCAAGGDLRTRAGQERALLAYNHSDEYVAQVLALAAAYRDQTPVSGRPAGDTTGPLPPVRHHGPLPPVNPLGPTAADPRTSPPGATHSSAAPAVPPRGSVSGNPVGGGGASPSGAETTQPTDPASTAAGEGSAQQPDPTATDESATSCADVGCP